MIELIVQSQVGLGVERGAVWPLEVTPQNGWRIIRVHIGRPIVLRIRHLTQLFYQLINLLVLQYPFQLFGQLGTRDCHLSAVTE